MDKIIIITLQSNSKIKDKMDKCKKALVVSVEFSYINTDQFVVFKIKISIGGGIHSTGV
jgi:hypothetical protein